MLDRDIARLAAELVRAQKQEGDPKHETESTYRAECESLPVLLRTAGLTRAVTYLKAKGAERNTLYEHLQAQLQSLGIYTKDRKLDLIELVTSPAGGVRMYQHYSSLAMRIAYWHKRMAQALLNKREPTKEAPKP